MLYCPIRGLDGHLHNIGQADKHLIYSAPQEDARTVVVADFPQVGTVHGIVVQVTCLHHTTEKLSGEMGRYYIDIEKTVV